MRGEKYIASGVAAATLLILGGTACGTEATCLSPFKISSEYPGTNKPEGLEVDTPMIKGAKQLEIGFTDPGDNWHDEWLPANESHRLAMSIGSEAVRFRVRIKASAGSSICSIEPNTIFKVKPYDRIFKEGGVAPDPSKFRLDEPR